MAARRRWRGRRCARCCSRSRSPIRPLPVGGDGAALSDLVRQGRLRPHVEGALQGARHARAQGARAARRRRRSTPSSTGTRTWSTRCRPGRPIATPSTSRKLKTDEDWMAEGAGHRVSYSPAVMTHLFGNYARVLGCMNSIDGIAPDAPPARARQLHRLLRSANFPSVRRWSRRSGGAPSSARSCRPSTPRADGLQRRWDAGADWEAPLDGEGQRRSGRRPHPPVRLPNGSVFRLVGLHVITKELRKWLWVTIWWSPDGDGDFGADRPADLEADPIFRHYKMCVVSAHDERDPSAPPGPTWCTNPYLERGAGNARTNCIGCHQHGGTSLQPEEIIGDETRFPDRRAPRGARQLPHRLLVGAHARGQPRTRRRRRGRLLRLVREMRRP